MAPVFAPGVIVRTGTVAVRKGGLKIWNPWKEQWLVLETSTLTIYKNDSETHALSLNCLTKVERTNRKPYCLLLEVRDHGRYYLSFQTDEALYKWHDDLYSLSLGLSMDVPNVSDSIGAIGDYSSWDSPGLSPQPSTPTRKTLALKNDPQLPLAIDKFIASTRAVVSTNFGDEELTRNVMGQKVNQHLTTFLLQVASHQDERIRTPLERLVSFIISLNYIWSLVHSQQFRVKLLQISVELGVSNDRRLLEALQKDDIAVADSFKSILYCEVGKKAVLRLRGENAQRCLDVIQDVLDKGSIDDPESSLNARRFLVKLSIACDLLPSSLFIRGVTRQEQEATFGGAFGDIYQACYQGEDVALKRIRVFQRDCGQHEVRRKLCREALMWKQLHHPFVLPFRGIDAESFSHFLCMVSPWCHQGTILKHLNDTENSNIPQRLWEIAQGLEYLHRQNIVHGDLRGANILVNHKMHACLADFGLAVFSDTNPPTCSSYRGGSIRWMPPELLDPQSSGLRNFKRTFASDVYSFACVCIELYTGKPPFSELAHDATAMLKVLARERPSRPEGGDQGGTPMPDYLWKIVQLCWKHKSSRRPAMDEVVKMLRDGIRAENVESRSRQSVHDRLAQVCRRDS